MIDPLDVAVPKARKDMQVSLGLLMDYWLVSEPRLGDQCSVAGTAASWDLSRAPAFIWSAPSCHLGLRGLTLPLPPVSDQRAV